MTIKYSIPCIFLVAATLASFVAIPGLGAAPVAQTGFERGDQPWEFYVLAESESAGCALSIGKVDTHQGTSYAVLSAKTPAELGLHPKANPVLVAPGEKYRFTAWIKAGPGWLTAAQSPGVVLRCTLYDAYQKELTSGPLFVGLKGVSRDPVKLSGPPISSIWTKIEGVIEIPSGASEMIPFVFVWRGSGQVFVDDISIDKVPAETPLSTLVD